MTQFVIQITVDDILIKSYIVTAKTPVRTYEQVPFGRKQIVFDDESAFKAIISDYETYGRKASYTYNHSETKFSIEYQETVDNYTVNEIGFIDKTV